MSQDGRAIADTASNSTPETDLEIGLQPQREMEPSEDGGAQAESTALPVPNDAVAGAGAGVQRRQLKLPPIPRVRGLLHGAAPEQFTPQIVPIGPYHVDQVGSYLLQSTGVKGEDVQQIIDIGVDFEGLKALVSTLVKDVRPCYTHLPEGTMNDPGKFSEMLLLDGCYLLCHLIDFKSLVAGNRSSGGGAASGSNSGGGNGGGGGGGGGSSSSVASGSNGGGSNGGGGCCGCLGNSTGSGSTGASSSNSGGGNGGGSGGSSSSTVASASNGGRSNGGGGVCCCLGSRSGSGSRNGDVGREIAANQRRVHNDNTLVRDILYLLENQIPLPVLEAILRYMYGTENIDYDDLIYRPVRGVLQQRKYISPNREPVTSLPSDLLHLVYSYFRRGPGDVLPAWSAQRRFRKRTGRWRRATDYRKYADLKFKCRKEFKEGQQWTILDIHIEGGTLYIPFLQVNHDTCTMLRNLMALEEKENKRPVTAYCLFMSQVASKAEDVQLLQRAGILEHLMPNDEEAANVLANLCVGVAMEIDSLDRNYLKHLWHALDKRCRKPLNNFKGFFRDKYCSTVFYRLVFVVAFLVFAAEVTQAICAVIK